MSRSTPSSSRWSQLSRWLLTGLACVVLYVLSSGPVMATAFWLRETYHWDGFYAVMWLYAPIVMLDPDSLPLKYVEWWVNLFGTVGPG